jgi:uncharacterized MAPEG superfamily protein
MEPFDAYGHALASVALFALIVMVFSPLSAIEKGKKGLAPGAEPKADYADRTYRLHRVFANGTDSLTIFAAVTVVAILAGASPFWVNLLASLTLVARGVMIVLHVGAIGQPHNGPRSFAYVAGMICMFALAALGLVAAF